MDISFSKQRMIKFFIKKNYLETTGHIYYVILYYTRNLTYYLYIFTYYGLYYRL